MVSTASNMPGTGPKTMQLSSGLSQPLPRSFCWTRQMQSRTAQALALSSSADARSKA